MNIAVNIQTVRRQSVCGGGENIIVLTRKKESSAPYLDLIFMISASNCSLGTSARFFALVL